MPHVHMLYLLTLLLLEVRHERRLVKPQTQTRTRTSQCVAGILVISSRRGLAALSEATETYSLRFKAANTIHNGRPSFLYRSEYAHDEKRSEEQA